METPRPPAPPPTLGLALGGGAMKGWAHIGVLAVLQRYGLRPHLLAGCSAGAVIAAFVARGYTMDDLVKAMRGQKTASLFPYRFDRHALLSTKEFRAYLREHLGDGTLEDLPSPLFVTATDLVTGKEVVLSQGPLVEALLASSAMPGYFAPVRFAGRLLVDGGLRNSVPVSALVNHGATYTIGVQMHKPLGALEADLYTPEKDPDMDQRVDLNQWLGWLRQRLPAPLKQWEGRRRSHPELPNLLDVLQRSLEVMMLQIETDRLHSYPPDVLIQPHVQGIGAFAFSQEKEVIYQRGVEAAERAGPQLDRLATLMGH